MLSGFACCEHAGRETMKQAWHMSDPTAQTAAPSIPISISSRWPMPAISPPVNPRIARPSKMFVRRLPPHRNFILAAGLAQAVDYLLNLRFTTEDIDYLRTLPQFEKASPGFFEMLANLRFTGDLFAVPEGTPLFSGEPFLTLRAPIMEAQLPETYLLAMVGFQSMIATKAARVTKAAGGRGVVEFGTRRAHSPEAGVLAARAAYIGGCIGTSNTETGFRYGIPTFGTAAHSWVMSFASEREAFAELQKLLGEQTIYVVDTYETLEGTRQAAALGRPLWGVRLDSGNLVELSFRVRRILDDAGLARREDFRHRRFERTQDSRTDGRARTDRCLRSRHRSCYLGRCTGSWHHL